MGALFLRLVWRLFRIIPKPQTTEPKPQHKPTPVALASEKAAPSLASATRSIERAVADMGPAVRELKDGERKRLGGILFQGSTHFVGMVAQALARRPHLSPDPQRINATSLRAHLAKASGWAMLHQTLVRLARQANDNYLYEQGMAVAESHKVLDHYDLGQKQALIRAGERRSAAPLDAEALEDQIAIETARVILTRRKLRIHLHKAQAQSKKPPTTPPRQRRLAGLAPDAPLIDVQRWVRSCQDPTIVNG